jgi:hypothetical protein
MTNTLVRTRWEVCDHFVADDEDDDVVCRECGWLADDHQPTAA